jgi:hypothetical protein
MMVVVVMMVVGHIEVVVPLALVVLPDERFLGVVLHMGSTLQAARRSRDQVHRQVAAAVGGCGWMRMGRGSSGGVGGHDVAVRVPA